jgi:hypothetical protein
MFHKASRVQTIILLNGNRMKITPKMQKAPKALAGVRLTVAISGFDNSFMNTSKAIIGLFLFLACSNTLAWTGPDQVMSKTATVETKASDFQAYLSPTPQYKPLVEDLTSLLSSLSDFRKRVESGCTEDEADLDYERLRGVYTHADSAISHALNFNFPAMTRWRGVEWAWEELAMAMYGSPE